MTNIFNVSTIYSLKFIERLFTHSKTKEAAIIYSFDGKSGIILFYGQKFKMNTVSLDSYL